MFYAMEDFLFLQMYAFVEDYDWNECNFSRLLLPDGREKSWDLFLRVKIFSSLIRSIPVLYSYTMWKSTIETSPF